VNAQLSAKSRSGSLVVVGTGIQSVGQFTIETISYIRNADKLLYLVTEPTTAIYLRDLNSSAESLSDLYEVEVHRMVSYEGMVDRTLGYVRDGLAVCVAYYGHPGVYVYPSHEAIRRAKQEGYPAKMLPGVSAEDCLFADLGIDPSIGCQSFEATSFLVRQPQFDTTNLLILWQVGVVGDLTFQPDRDPRPSLRVLTDYLMQFYPADHRVVMYESSAYPTCESRMDVMTLAEIPDAAVNGISTLCIYPNGKLPPDSEMSARLGLAADLPHGSG
jgi:hypothetical protein